MIRLPKRHWVFLSSSALAWTVALVLWGAHLLYGPALIAMARPEASPAYLEDLVRRVDQHFVGSLVLFVLLQLGAWLVYAAVRLGSAWRVALASTLLTYAVVETWVAPRLSQPLGLENFYFVRDVDHWPKPDDPDAWDGQNSDVIRCAWESTAFTEESLNVVFLGDSFTAGLRVRAEEAFPGLLGPRLSEAFPAEDVRTANFGWVSSSPLLSLRRLRAIGPRYRPDLVVLCVDMTDFHDDIRWSNMLERRGLYRFYDRIPITLRLLHQGLPLVFDALHEAVTNDNLPDERYFVSEQPLDESRPYLERITLSIEETAAFCAELGSEFLVFVLPRSYQCNADECPDSWEKERYTILGPHCLEPFRFFEELSPTVGYPIHSLLDAFRETEVFPTCFRDDPHWNPGGHRVAAKAMLPILRARCAEILAGR